MADENRPSSIIEQCILDITECPICNEVLKDNRCLPCLHMFCLKCLELYRKGKPKGKPLPCPVCRREFSIQKSIAGLPRNFFIDRLLDAHKIKKQDVLPTICEICSDDNCKRRFTSTMVLEETDVALATRYCCDCRQHMCLSCERQHKKIKATAWHKIIDSASVTDLQELTPMPTYCLTHKTKEAEVFCQDCKVVICWQCKALSHNNHVSLDVSSATKDLAAKLEEHIEQISTHLHNKQDHIRKLTEREKWCTYEIEVESTKIHRVQRKLYRMITDNGDKLKKELTTSSTVYLNAIRSLRDKLETDANELMTHKVYIEQMIHLGNACDLCEHSDKLILKTATLAEEHTCEIDIPPVTYLSEADLQDLLTEKRKGISRPLSNAGKENDNKDQSPPTEELKEHLKGTASNDDSGEETGEILVVTDNCVEQSPCDLTKSYAAKPPSDEDSSKCKDWSLIKTIASEDDRSVCCITVLDSMLYVVSQDSSNISVYNATELKFLTNITVDSLANPNDIVSCKFSNCLYICDWGTGRIFRVRVIEEMEQINWSTGKDMGCLSVTIEHTVLMAGYISGKLKEYAPNGELIRSIDLRNGVKPWHAIRLVCPNTQYLVCEGDNSSAFHRVCLIDQDGRVINSYGGVKGSDEKHLFGPYHLAIDKNGCIIVNDCNNSRILLLSKDLKFINEIIPSSANLLRRARRMYLDEDASRLYVAENAKSGGQTKDGRILVFSSCGIKDSMV